MCWSFGKSNEYFPRVCLKLTSNVQNCFSYERAWRLFSQSQEKNVVQNIQRCLFGKKELWMFIISFLFKKHYKTFRVVNVSLKRCTKIFRGAFWKSFLFKFSLYTLLFFYLPFINEYEQVMASQTCMSCFQLVQTMSYK